MKPEWRPLRTHRRNRNYASSSKSMNMLTIIQAGTTVSACFFMLCSVVEVSSQVAPASVNRPVTDSVFRQREVTKSDSTIVPFYSLGRLGFNDSSESYQLTKQQRRSVQYRSLPDAMIRHSPFMPMSQGGFGQFNSISIYGSNITNQTASVDGRTVVHPWSGVYNLELVAPEGLERAEVLTGTKAIGMASTLTQQTINLQSMRFNTATPYTAFWYAQGGGDFIAADVALAQNVSAKTNVSLGIRRTGANGRYMNTQFDIWNVRASVRTSFSHVTQGLLTYQLASANSGMWGGLRTVPSLAQSSETGAVPVFSNLQDQTRRHDLTLNLVHLLNPDSSQVLTTLVYGSIDNMLRLRDSVLFVDKNDTLSNVTFRGNQAGALVKYDVSISTLNFKMGAGVDYSTTNATPYSAAAVNFQPQLFGLISNQFGKSVLLSMAVRTQMHWDRMLFGGGANGLFILTPTSKLLMDVSYAQKAPSVLNGIALQAENHLLGTVEFTMDESIWNFNSTAFLRQISNTILTNSNRDSSQMISQTTSFNGGTSTIAGLYLSATWHNAFLELRSNLRLSYSAADAVVNSQFPTILADASAAYVYRVGSNSVRIGVRGVVVSPMNSMQFVPLSWTFIQPLQQQGWASSGLDGFLMAIVGNAAVKLSYENALAQRWYTTAISPEIVRDFRLSVTWSFFD